MKLQRGAAQKGFSLLEIAATMVVIALLVAVAVTRRSNDPTRAITVRDVLIGQLRAAQMRSMQSGGVQTGPAGTVGQVYGLTSDGANAYWMFSGNDPNAAGAVVKVLDDPAVMNAAGKVLLPSKKVTTTAFTVIFSGLGIPCTAYTNESTYTAMAAPLTITVTDPNQQVPVTQTLTLTPGTGYIP